MITNKDEQIQDLQTESHNKDRKNDELKRQINQLEEKINTHQTTIDDLHRTLSEKDEQIQDLQTESHNKDRKNVELKRQINQLEEKILTKEGEVKPLKAESRGKERENEKLRQQVDQFQDINIHPGIRDIAVRATGDDPAFGKYFRTLDIDKNLPETLRNWLIRHLRTDPNSRKRLPTLIREYADFGEFDEYDVQLAHAIRTQRELIAYRRQEIDERTIMGRALCCFFAAALLSPKLPEPKQPAFK